MIHFDLKNFDSQKCYWWWFGVIILIAAALRLYQLGQVPHGMTWDEAAIGYNGYAVIHARRDEWLVRLPVSFKSFGDYKAPLAIYVNGIFTYPLGEIFGMKLWIVRLPFALAGVAAVAGIMFLTSELMGLSGLSKDRRQSLSLAAGAMLAFSPWHLHFSRLGFESGLALFFLIWGVWGICKILTAQKSWWRWVLVILATVDLVCAMYTYHSAKLVVPLVTAVLVLCYWRRVREHLVELAAVMAGSLIALWPLLKDSWYGSGNERFHQASLFSTAETPLAGLKIMGEHFITHFQLAFLVGGQTETLRHGDGMWGVLFPTTLILVLVAVIGLVVQVRKRTSTLTNLTSLVILGLCWIGLGVLPAAMGVDAPHSNRALLALPGFVILAVVGLEVLVQVVAGSQFNKRWIGTHGEKNIVIKAVLGTWVLVHLAFFLSYQQHYYTAFAAESAVDFKDGYLAAFEYVIPYEKGLNGHQKVDQVVFSSRYGQPYIYALFTRRTDPIWYQHGSLNKYLFTDKINSGDLERANTVVVAAPGDDVPVDKADKIIYGSDGAIKFIIFTPD